MKAFGVVLKILAAAAAVVGAIYVAATYGDKIVAWAKKMLPECPCCKKDAPAAEEVVEASEETVVEEEAVVEETASEPVAEIIVEENEPVAEENDFAE